MTSFKNRHTLWFFHLFSSAGAFPLVLGLVTAASGQEGLEPAPVGNSLAHFAPAFPYGGNPRNFITMGGHVYFLANDAAYGQELWKSDGTTGGTAMLMDLTPGPDSSRIGNLTVAGDVFYFTSGDGGMLWRSDGTAAGTVSLDAVGAATGTVPTRFAELKVMNGILYFGGGSDRELWRTDWTSAGTRMVRDILPGNPGSNPRRLTVVGSTLYFVADTLEAGSELWKSDGTEAGTVMVKDIAPGQSSGLVTGTFTTRLAGAGGLVFFAASTAGAGVELWRSDGTEAGTIMLKDIQAGSPSSDPAVLTAAGNQVFFIAHNETSGYELWRSDGTPPGTVMQRDLITGSQNGAVQFPGTDDQPVALAGVVYFSGATLANGRELWRTDGTAAGTYLLKNIAPEGENGGTQSSSPKRFFVLGNRVFFEAADQITSQSPELWMTDGSAAGTVPVRTFLGGLGVTPGEYSFGSADTTAMLGDEILFSGRTSTDGNELWKFNPQAGTASLVKSFSAVSSPGAVPVGPLVPCGSGAYFMANSVAEGKELWRTDGPGKPPVQVKDLLPGTASGNPANLTPAGTGNGLYFTATLNPAGTGLFKTDGTPSGTVLLKSFPEQNGSSAPTQLTMLGNRLLFVAATPDTGVELWASDGTPEGTTIVRELTAGNSASGISSIAVVGDTAWFGAYNGTPLPEAGLWRTDGTAAGTSRIRPFPSNGNSIPSFLTSVGSRLYFTAATDAAGRELWRSDGLASSTVMVKDIAPGVVDGVPTTGRLTAMGNSVYFWGHQDGSDGGDKLWTSDGTAAGTKLIGLPAGAGPGVGGDFPVLTRCGNVLFYQLFSQATGLELWKTDGTSAGTAMVKDIFPGPVSSSVNILGQKDGILYFAATDDSHGRELWRSDGTDAGTFMVEDLLPGTDSSQPLSMAPVEDGILYAVEDDGSGKPGLRQLIWPAMLGEGEISQVPGSGMRLIFRGLRVRTHAVDASTDLVHWTMVETLDPKADGTMELPVPVAQDIRRYFRARDVALKPVP